MIGSSTTYNRRARGAGAWSASVCLGGSVRGLIITLLLLCLAVAIAGAQVTVTSPNGGESFELGQPVAVSWSSSGVSTLRLDYSSDNGAVWSTVASGIPAAGGAATFTPFGVPTAAGLVRLVDEANPARFDRSDAPFAILASKLLAILDPAQGDEVVAGSTTNIVWQSSRVDRVAIEYTTNGGGSWNTITSSTQAGYGSFPWRVPGTPAANVQIRVRELGGDAFAVSGLFSIVPSKTQMVRVQSPNGGEVFIVGDTTRILWSTAYAPVLWISYSSDGGATWTRIRNTLPSELGFIPWAVPDVPSKNYLIRIETGSQFDVSDAPFEVRRKINPGITVLKPNGGEQFRPDSVVKISWSWQDFSGENVVVEYSIDGGATWRGIATVDVAAGPVSWTVPDSASTNALIRVHPVTTPISDVSDAPFEILHRPPPPPGPIKVLSPNGGEDWAVGGARVIRWDAPADVTQVKIEISVDGGFAFTPIFGAAPSTPGNGQYAWTVTNTPTTTARVRITDVNDPSRYDLSDGNFTISLLTVGVREDARAVTGIASASAVPNPASGNVELRWTQRSRAGVTVRLYDAVGTLVRVVDAGVREGGEQRLPLAVGDLASGLYRFQIVGEETFSGQISVIH